MKKDLIKIISIISIATLTFANNSNIKIDNKSKLDLNKINGIEHYVKCKGCHGKFGEKHALGKSRIINTFTKSKIETALNGYKNGTYGGSMKGIMKGQVSSFSKKDIKDLSSYIYSFKHSKKTQISK